MKYSIIIDNLESSLSEQEIESVLYDALLGIAKNYGEVQIDVMEEE